MSKSKHTFILELSFFGDVKETFLNRRDVAEMASEDDGIRRSRSPQSFHYRQHRSGRIPRGQMCYLDQKDTAEDVRRQPLDSNLPARGWLWEWPLRCRVKRYPNLALQLTVRPWP